MDVERMQQDRRRLIGQLEQRDRDLRQIEQHEKQLTRANKILTGKLKTEKDEVFVFTCCLFSVDRQTQ